MYQLTYYINGKTNHYEFIFQSLWGAIFKARAIFEEHGIPTDVTSTLTGEVFATFNTTEIWTDPDLEVDLQVLAHKTLE